MLRQAAQLHHPESTDGGASAKRFGGLLRLYRQAGRTPKEKKLLSQERLAEWLSLESGTEYSAQAVSEWERGKSRPLHTKRGTLVALVKILHAGGGLTSPTEADTLLLAGGYSPFTDAERTQINPHWANPTQSTPNTPPLINGALRLIVQRFSEPFERLVEAVQSWRAESKDLPPTGVVFELMRQATQGWTFAGAFRQLVWVALIWLTWALMWPLFHWPFTSEAELWKALLRYSVGGWLLPFLIAWRTSFDEAAFWNQPRPNVSVLAVSVYMQQGAAIGFHLAYFFNIGLALLAHNLEITPAPRWAEYLAACAPVGLGYAAAREVPFNLWRAYEKVHLRPLINLVPTLAFVLVVPFWVVFFYSYHAWLLHLFYGPAIILGALLLFTGWHARPRKTMG